MKKTVNNLLPEEVTHQISIVIIIKNQKEIETTKSSLEIFQIAIYENSSWKWYFHSGLLARITQFGQNSG
jgi:hypothetical protein